MELCSQRPSLFFFFYLCIAAGQICNACLAMVATAACVCACVFASVHVSQLLAMECQSPAVNASNLSWTTDARLNSTCLCIGGERKNEVFTYDPLSCSEVLEVLPIYLLTSAVTNGLAILVSSWYIVLLWSNRCAYTYAGLKLSECNANNAAMPSLYQWKERCEDTFVKLSITKLVNVLYYPSTQYIYNKCSNDNIF